VKKTRIWPTESQQIDGELEKDDDHPSEEEMDQRYGRTGRVDRDKEVTGVAAQVHAYLFGGDVKLNNGRMIVDPSNDESETTISYNGDGPEMEVMNRRYDLRSRQHDLRSRKRKLILFRKSGML
jgi:hypothetical protein